MATSIQDLVIKAAFGASAVAICYQVWKLNIDSWEMNKQINELKKLGITLDVDQFNQNGCLVVKGFASAEECDNMRNSMAKLINDWDPSELAVFRTDKKQEKEQGSSDYFLDSANRIHFFLEPGSVEESTGTIKEGILKELAINKVGHGLHLADTTFEKYSQSSKVAALVRALGWKDPVLPQSMYIFKQPKIGGEVTSHQDSTFLHTTPQLTCLGLWLALEDATEENGCVWGRPGSHHEPLRRQFMRNPQWFDQNDKTASQMKFKNLVDVQNSPCPWEGGMPTSSSSSGNQRQAVVDAGFVPLLCKKGDLVLIHGQVDHLSLANSSGKSRHTFQLHLVEGPNEGITWNKTNWLQYPQGHIFPKLTKTF